MTTAQLMICLAIAVYLIAMLGVGVWFAKKNNSVDDFYLGGRKLGPFVTAMSAEASDMSSWLLMGLPGVAYISGLAEASWTAIGLAVGTYLNWLIVARRIRRYSNHLDAITVPQFFSKRWGDDRNLLSAIAAVVIIVFFIPYLASGFSACGKLFASLFGTSYVTAMLISAAVIVIYTVMGGFLAASFTDLIQSIIMTVALIVVLSFGVAQAGGLDAVMDNARSLAGYLSLTHIHDATTGGSSPYSLLTICSLLAWGLGYFGMPHILLRFMAIEEEKKLALSRRVATIWVVISMGVAIFIGVVGNGMTKAGAMEQLADSETIIVQIASLISHYGIFAALVAGVILAGILAATMSTADSQMLAASSSVGGVFPSQNYREKKCDRGQKYYGCHCPGGSVFGQRPQQLCFPGGIFCLGWLRRSLWAGGTVRSILEKIQQVGRAGRYGCGRSHGIHLEIWNCHAGGRICNLRIAAGIYCCVGRHCCGQSADGKAQRGD